MDSNLQIVVDAWKNLPGGLKGAILAIVASKQSDK